MSERTIGQQLGDALAENARLRALLPPDLGPGLTYRVGRRCPENLYVTQGPGEDGFELAKLPTAEYAAHIASVLNAWGWDGQTTEAQRVLALPMQPNDAEVPTIRAYLVELIVVLWKHPGYFTGTAPFGNSDWEWELYAPLVKAGLIDGAFDEHGDLEECDELAGRKFITAAIAELEVAR